MIASQLAGLASAAYGAFIFIIIVAFFLFLIWLLFGELIAKALGGRRVRVM